MLQISCYSYINRLVNTCLEEELKSIHAFTQKTYTEDQWKKMNNWYSTELINVNILECTFYLLGVKVAYVAFADYGHCCTCILLDSKKYHNVLIRINYLACKLNVMRVWCASRRSNLSLRRLLQYSFIRTFNSKTLC